MVSLAPLASRPLTFAAKATASQSVQDSEANPYFTKKLEPRVLVHCPYGGWLLSSVAGPALTCNWPFALFPFD